MTGQAKTAPQSAPELRWLPASGGLDVRLCKHDATAAMRALVKYLPLSLAVREIMRMRALAEFGVLRLPLLDIGCGDGLFWEVLARDLLAGNARALEGLVGIDIDEGELKLASMRLSPKGGAIRRVDISGELTHSGETFESGTFRTIIANCSLEHVPRLESALSNIHRCLAPDGELYLFVPTPNWTDTFVSKQVLRRLGGRVSGTYAGLWDGFYQHHHLYPAWVWGHLLRGVGFEPEIRAIGSRTANRLAERWLPPAFLSFLYKSVFRRYPTRMTAPIKSLFVPRLAPFLREIEAGAVIHDDLEHREAVEYAIRCRPARRPHAPSLAPSHASAR